MITKRNLILLLSMLIICLILYLFFYKDIIEENADNYTLHNEGVQIFKNIINQEEIAEYIDDSTNEKYEDIKRKLLKHPGLLATTQKNLGSPYIFQDYIWIIKKSVVHTCHRDNNGDFFNEKQRYPSYTMLIYLEDMEKCLGVIPESHKNKNENHMNFVDKVVNLPCNKGDVIIFNANLIHVGCINEKDDNLRIQMKITHTEDIPHLQYYQNFNKILNKDNSLPVFLRRGQKRFSCMFPILSDLTQKENIRTARGSDNGVQVGTPQRMFSYLFYGNPDFYDLPNAF